MSWNEVGFPCSQVEMGSWKLVSPKNKIVGSNNPFRVINAVFHSFPFFIHIFLYSHHKSKYLLCVICKFHLSGKLHPCGDATSEPYKPAFHGGHLSRNIFYGGATTFRIFCLSQQRYSYSTQSSMTELLLSVSQH